MESKVLVPDTLWLGCNGDKDLLQDQDMLKREFRQWMEPNKFPFSIYYRPGFDWCTVKLNSAPMRDVLMKLAETKPFRPDGKRWVINPFYTKSKMAPAKPVANGSPNRLGPEVRANSTKMPNASNGNSLMKKDHVAPDVAPAKKAAAKPNDTTKESVKKKAEEAPYLSDWNLTEEERRLLKEWKVTNDQLSPAVRVANQPLRQPTPDGSKKDKAKKNVVQPDDTTKKEPVKKTEEKVVDLDGWNVTPEDMDYLSCIVLPGQVHGQPKAESPKPPADTSPAAPVNADEPVKKTNMAWSGVVQGKSGVSKPDDTIKNQTTKKKKEAEEEERVNVSQVSCPTPSPGQRPDASRKNVQGPPVGLQLEDWPRPEVLQVWSGVKRPERESVSRGEEIPSALASGHHPDSDLWAELREWVRVCLGKTDALDGGSRYRLFSAQSLCDGVRLADVLVEILQLNSAKKNVWQLSQELVPKLSCRPHEKGPLIFAILGFGLSQRIFHGISFPRDLQKLLFTCCFKDLNSHIYNQVAFFERWTSLSGSDQCYGVAHFPHPLISVVFPVQKLLARLKPGSRVIFDGFQVDPTMPNMYMATNLIMLDDWKHFVFEYKSQLSGLLSPLITEMKMKTVTSLNMIWPANLESKTLLPLDQRFLDPVALQTFDSLQAHIHHRLKESHADLPNWRLSNLAWVACSVWARLGFTQETIINEFLLLDAFGGYHAVWNHWMELLELSQLPLQVDQLTTTPFSYWDTLINDTYNFIRPRMSGIDAFADLAVHLRVRHRVDGLVRNFKSAIAMAEHGSVTNLQRLLANMDSSFV